MKSDWQFYIVRTMMDTYLYTICMECSPINNNYLKMHETLNYTTKQF